MASRNQIASEPAPHSWDLEHWPAHVWPHSTSRAKWVVRSQRDALMAAGAISRIGRELIIFGGPYTKYLQAGAANVAGYECAANRERSAPSAA